MNNLRTALDNYLTLRRGLGFKLERIETHLRKFVGFMANRRTTRITTALALEFAVEAAELAPCTMGSLPQSVVESVPGRNLLLHLWLAGGDWNAR